MKISIKRFFSEGIQWNVVFLVAVIFPVFIIPFFPSSFQRILYNVSFTMIFILGYLNSDRRNPAFIPLAISAVILVWFSAFFKLKVLFTFSYFLNILFFGIVIFNMVKHLITSKTVTLRIILEAIIIYLLIGLIFSMVVSVIDYYDPVAFSFPHHEAISNAGHLDDFIYFTFITLSTTGYGDIIPLQPYARSLSIFIAITGQMYIAIIIAMLVGKYAASKQDDRYEE